MGNKLLLLLLTLFITPLTWAASIENPQLQMIGARSASLGGTNPVLNSDINSLFINPASLGTIDPMPLVISHQKILEEFEVNLIHASLPVKVPFRLNSPFSPDKISLGVSYGSNMLSGIPDTIRDQGRNRQVGSFSSGFEIVQTSAGVSYFDILDFNHVAFGAGVKAVRQKVKSASRTAYGVDIGTMATYHVDHKYVSKLHLGASMINFLSTDLPSNSDQEKASMPINAFVGGRVDLLDDKYSIFIHNGIENLTLGGEATLQESLSFRVSSDFERLNLGLGLTFNNIAGFGKQNYSLRLDYNLTQNVAPFDSDTTTAFSLTVLGQSRPRTPKILTPKEDFSTQQQYVDLNGVGPKFTTIRIYNNDNLTRTVLTNRYGKWSFKNFPLKEGPNVIYIKAYELEKDDSVKSNEITITSDTIAPEIDVKIFPENSYLVIQAKGSEPLEELNGQIDGTKLTLTKNEDDLWTGRVVIPKDIQPGQFAPKELKTLELFAKDEAGNTTPPITNAFFIELNFPKDKTVHYKDTLRFIGTSSEMTTAITVAGYPVYIDPKQKFSISTPLKPGKNLVPIKVTTIEDKELMYTLRVLYLKTFDDINKSIKERREIEFLATLGVFDGDPDGKFYPDKYVTRRFITKTIMNISGYPTEKVESNLYPDVSKNDPDAKYIQAAIKNGLVFAYPDGTFKPDQPLTFSEIVFLLTNAGIIDGAAGADFAETAYMDRKSLAKFLAYTPNYEIKIERLIDWEKGYKLP